MANVDKNLKNHLYSQDDCLGPSIIRGHTVILKVSLILYGFCLGLPVTLDTLHASLVEKQKYFNCRSSLAQVLKNLGFSYKKDSNRRSLMEKPTVQRMRREFLKKFMENEDLGENKNLCVFLDETWIFSNGSFRRSWQDDDIRSVRKTSGEGARYIILHAGSEKGFVDGASRIFKSRTKTGDYHGEMNAENFEKWVRDDLLPNLKRPSLVILDNASYHSRLLENWPNSGWKKENMVKWLEERNIPFETSATKKILWCLIQRLPKPPKSYVVDALIQEAGHQVLRLPPYHCEFNAIEMVWSQGKRAYDELILGSKDVLKTWEMALSQVKPENWANYVRHVKEIIKTFWEKEKQIISSVEPLVIEVDTDGDDDDSSES